MVIGKQHKHLPILKKRNIEIAEDDFKNFIVELRSYFSALEAYEVDLEKAGAPYTPNRKL